MMVLTVVLALLTGSAKFEVSCEQVRAYVAEHGQAKALVYALQHGASWKQIREARACLKQT